MFVYICTEMRCILFFRGYNATPCPLCDQVPAKLKRHLVQAHHLTDAQVLDALKDTNYGKRMRRGEDVGRGGI